MARQVFKVTYHAEYRLNSRVQPQHTDVASRMIERAVNYSNAALVASVGRKVSLVVIVRDKTPVTVMYARSGQVNLSHLRVQEIVTL